MFNWANFLYKAIRLVYKTALMSALFSNQFNFTRVEKLYPIITA